ncbi:ATP-dependent DNA helicase PIF1 [Trifolium medium]|uniref:ATP-dependent DNA helicase PIF1 n=1 Tax=Trifolium medium TaxID=97028 RepID=A0A392M164_9FABA|nr:ATP-dependent DNA helicase PIF1 [Trifolium medium]
MFPPYHILCHKAIIAKAARERRKRIINKKRNNIVIPRLSQIQAVQTPVNIINTNDEISNIQRTPLSNITNGDINNHNIPPLGIRENNMDIDPNTPEVTIHQGSASVGSCSSSIQTLFGCNNVDTNTAYPDLTPFNGLNNSINVTPISEVVDPEPSNTMLRCRNRYANIVSAVAPTRIDFEDEYVSDNEDDSYDYTDNQEDQHRPEDQYDPSIHSMIYEQAETELCHDVGDPSFSCQFCYSRMWFDERAEQDMSIDNLEFSLCCMRGKVALPFLTKPPELLLNLLNGNHRRSNHFLENFRAYNSMFSYTSLGGKVESKGNNGGGPPQFVLSGQNYHRIGSLLPQQDGTPKFAQLYIYDTKNEVHNRMKHVRYI